VLLKQLKKELALSASMTLVAQTNYISGAFLGQHEKALPISLEKVHRAHNTQTARALNVLNR
jgi:hypothetical protein